MDSNIINNSFKNCGTAKGIANNPGYSNFEDFEDEMDRFDGRGASVYDQEYDSDEELVDLAESEDMTETDSSGEDMATESEVSDEDIATEAEAETTRPTRHARQTQNVFMAASLGISHNPLRRPPTVGPSADAADDDDNEGFSCKHWDKIYSNRA